MSKVLDRFLKYVKYNTQSDPEAEISPSSPGQLEFAWMLGEEMKAIGLEDVDVDDYGYVMGFVPSTMKNSSLCIGFISHIDTSPAMTGKHIMPNIIENYQGGDICLDKEHGIILSVEDSPELKNYINQTIVCTNGQTLLGSDGKAGIAEALCAAEYLLKHPDIKHPRIALCFTPDEEIGLGPSHFDIKKFGASFAFTLDGGELGCLEYENFNAAQAKIVFHGKSFHPGYCKGKLINSIIVAHNFIKEIPVKEFPENTTAYEGYYYVKNIKGGVERTELDIAIRDFDKEGFAWRKGVIENCVREFTKKYSIKIDIEIKDIYFNMKEKIEPVRYVIDIAKEAMKSLGITPIIKPIRGGTDGATLSYMGMPTPNLFSGGHNFHGRYEYIPVNSMERAVDVIVRISEYASQI